MKMSEKDMKGQCTTMAVKMMSFFMKELVQTAGMILKLN
jgi:hypothetical protein